MDVRRTGRLRLLFVGDASGYHVSKWIKFFGEAGHDVHIVSTGKAQIPGVTVHWVRNPFTTVGLRHSFYPYYAARVAGLLKRLQPDVVHALQINMYAFLAALAGARPLIVTPFGGDVLVRPKESMWVRWMVGYVLRRAALIVCDADHIVPVLRDLGAGGKPVKVVYFGVDVDRFRPLPPHAGWSEKLGVAGCRVVLSLRHLLPVYDIPTLIHAIPKVVATRPDVRFVIWGRGTEEQRIRALVAELGVTAVVHFGGWYEGAELPNMLSVASVYVSTSTSDAGLASSTGEAMAAAVPPVITDFGDNALWVRHGENGFLFPVGDHAALADALGTLLDQPDLRRQFGERSRAVIVERYNWATEMGRVESLYRETADHKRG